MYKIALTPYKEDIFHQNILVGPYPIERDPNWDIVFSVTDEYNELSDYWYPLAEFPLETTISMIFPILIKLLVEFNKGNKIYLHCTAGANRSVTIRDLFWFFLYSSNYPGIDPKYHSRIQVIHTKDRGIREIPATNYRYHENTIQRLGLARNIFENKFRNAYPLTNSIRNSILNKTDFKGIIDLKFRQYYK